jgi:hypothetical protein
MGLIEDLNTMQCRQDSKQLNLSWPTQAAPSHLLSTSPPSIPFLFISVPLIPSLLCVVLPSLYPFPLYFPSPKPPLNYAQSSPPSTYEKLTNFGSLGLPSGPIPFFANRPSV